MSEPLTVLPEKLEPRHDSWCDAVIFGRECDCGLDTLRAQAQRVTRAEADATAAFNLLSRVRFALGDNGRRMQDELIAHCEALAKLCAEVESLKAQRDRLNSKRA